MGPLVTRTLQPPRSMPRVVGCSDGAVDVPEGCEDDGAEGARAGVCDQEVAPDMLEMCSGGVVDWSPSTTIRVVVKKKALDGRKRHVKSWVA